MITAQVKFLQNSVQLDLSSPPYELSERLQKSGILTNPNMIALDNAMTLKVSLFPEDDTARKIIRIADIKKDTLGLLNALCYSIKCMDYRDEMTFINNLENNKYAFIDEALKDVGKMKEQRRILNKKKEHER